MLVVVVNESRKKSFRRSKRVISSVLPSITIRVNIGNLPRRVAIQLIENLKTSATRGTKVKLFLEDKAGYFGLKCVEVGPRSVSTEPFVMAASSIDDELQANKWLVTTLVPSKKEKTQMNQQLKSAAHSKGCPVQK